MVRGISKQVIVMDGGHRDFFESAIFILNEENLKEGIGEKELLRQAKEALTEVNSGIPKNDKLNRVVWAVAGFSASCGLWAITLLL